ncbi:MAG: hypothetical protein L0241_15100 [Planctomycetia bacterium]|nr:hypothetical protein [Planctomycetia bacterium]
MVKVKPQPGAGYLLDPFEREDSSLPHWTAPSDVVVVVGGVITVIEAKSSGNGGGSSENDNPLELIVGWVHIHGLDISERVRLLQVLWDYEPAVQKQELQEELRCILAARELATKPPLTNEMVDKAREAFASGRVPFVPQDMD